jgi:hypothetical protein
MSKPTNYLRLADARAAAALLLTNTPLAGRPAAAQTVNETDTASLNVVIAAVNWRAATTINITSNITLNAAPSAITT